MVATAKVWAFGSGKGGTGKSVLSSNVGVYLASKGMKVLLIDADFGATNLHTCLGMQPPAIGLNDYIQRGIKDFEQAAVATGINQLYLVSGAHDSISAANIKYQQKRRLIREVQRQNYDMVILDIGSGTGLTMADFFQAGEHGVFVMLPEPTSIENLYQLLVTVFFRRVRKFQDQPKIRSLITQALERTKESLIRTPQDLLTAVNEVSPELCKQIRDYMSQFHPAIVINQLRAEEDRELGVNIRTVAMRYFGIELDILGTVVYDDAVWKSVRKRRPVILEYPDSRAAKAIGAVAESLLLISEKPVSE